MLFKSSGLDGGIVIHTSESIQIGNSDDDEIRFDRTFRAGRALGYIQFYPSAKCGWTALTGGKKREEKNRVL